MQRSSIEWSMVYLVEVMVLNLAFSILLGMPWLKAIWPCID